MSEAEIREEYGILERSRKDPAAFGDLYEKYFDRIFNFIFRQTDDEELTADLCSQTFLIVLKNLSRYEYRGVPFSAWLYKIASNEVNKPPQPSQTFSPPHRMGQPLRLCCMADGCNRPDSRQDLEQPCNSGHM
jgi:hypothetical protein